MIKRLLNEHLLDPKNPYKIYDLAAEYDRLEQAAMAVSLYIKAADLEDEDKLLQYKCMIRAGKCYDRQGRRGKTVFCLYQHAVSILPERPEALYFLSEMYERIEEWRECLLYAKFGLRANQTEKLHDVPYPGKSGLLYLQAKANWRIQGTDRPKNELFTVKHRVELDAEHKAKVTELLDSIGYPRTIPYTSKDVGRYKFPFPGMYSIRKNYSKHFQDMFVLSVLNGKKNGTYVEIGSGDPFVNNNTALLETEFGWKGISIDNSEARCYDFSQRRRNTVICVDATEVDYEDMFTKHCMDITMDYLQVNCDEASLEVLKRIPFSKYKFAVVQFSHYSHKYDPLIKEISRKIMQDSGYYLLAGNIAFDQRHPYEDWWIHPDLVHSHNIDEKMHSDRPVNFAWDYMMNTEVLQKAEEYVE